MIARPRFRDVSDRYCQNCDGAGVFRWTENLGGYDTETGTDFYREHEDPCPACKGTGASPEEEEEGNDNQNR